MDDTTKVKIFYGFHVVVEKQKFDDLYQRLDNQLRRNKISSHYSNETQLATFSFGPSVEVQQADERITAHGIRYYDWASVIRVVGNALEMKNIPDDVWNFVLTLRTFLDAYCETISDVGWFGAELSFHDDVGYMLVDVLPMKYNDITTAPYSI